MKYSIFDFCVTGGLLVFFVSLELFGVRLGLFTVGYILGALIALTECFWLKTVVRRRRWRQWLQRRK